LEKFERSPRLFDAEFLGLAPAREEQAMTAGP
jgi:hypothetical protein